MASSSDMLSALRRYEDPEADLFEEFAERRLGPGGAFALLAGPLAERRPLAWAICPTIGPEQGNLRRLEALVARRLAGSGFEVARIRPDVHPLHGEISLPTRLAELEDAVDLLRGRGAGRVGLVGTLFGGTVAALAAERLEVAALALVEPAVRGRQYARELLRREAVADLMADEEGDAEGPKRELAATGRVTIRGLQLTTEAFETLGAVDLTSELRSFAGRSLLVGVSPSGEPGPGLRKLRDRLAELGGDVTVAGLADPLYAPLGEYYYRDAGLLRLDTRLELDGKIADAVAGWALDPAAASASA
jgi:pimeloyl-ACP methyl ester carboxylesterase